MKNYMETGTINHKNPSPGVFADFSTLGDLRDSMEKIQRAEDTFMQLPANIRTRFGNDPLNFVNFCGDPDNLDEAVSLGLAIKKAPTANNDEPNDDQRTQRPSQKPSSSKKPPQSSSSPSDDPS